MPTTETDARSMAFTIAEVLLESMATILSDVGESIKYFMETAHNNTNVIIINIRLGIAHFG